jgi:hypothetical protein
VSFGEPRMPLQGEELLEARAKKPNFKDLYWTLILPQVDRMVICAKKPVM